MTVEGSDQASSHSEDLASTGLYVDLENLQGEGQAMVESLIEEWPATFPRPSRIALCSPADEVELWRLWATNRFEDLDVVNHGTQHFSKSSSKNAADLAIATSAVADLLAGRVTHVAIFSDDSDFMSVFVAIRNEPTVPSEGGRVPFLWVVTDRVGSLSPRIEQFFPSEQLHVVRFNASSQAQGTGVKDRGSRPETKTQEAWTEMAAAIVEGIEPGSFKSTDCQKLISERWPPGVALASLLFALVEGPLRARCMMVNLSPGCGRCNLYTVLLGTENRRSRPSVVIALILRGPPAADAEPGEHLRRRSPRNLTGPSPAMHIGT